jgi:general secretion pathway protein D
MFMTLDAVPIPSRTSASALAFLVFVCAGASIALAQQEATTDKPGVIGGSDSNADSDDGGDDQDAQTNGQDGQTNNQGNQAGQQPQNGSPDQQGDVITPDNVDPNEEYNLPPNFDPSHRPRKTPDNVEVRIDFRDANLEEVVKFFSKLRDQNFIIGDSIQANKTITIISPEKVTLNQAYRAFLSALEMNGLTIVESGGFSKIVQASEAIKEPSRTYDEGDTVPNDARMVTSIIPVENGDIERIKEVIGNFTSQHATTLTYGSSLIISENAANVRRLRNLVDRLDKGQAGEQIFVYKVQYADATKVSEKLREIFKEEEGNQGGNRRRQKGDNQQGSQGSEYNVDVSQLIADERTNQLVIATNKRSFEKIQEMIELLDVPTKAGGGQVHVKFLEYANAEELSSTLSNLVSSTQQDQQQGRARARARRQRNDEGGGGGQVAALLQGDVQITSYKPNNALVVVASPKDFVALEQVIDTLDRPRKQVYVEAVIMEIGMDTNRTLGLGFNTGLGQDFGGVIPDSATQSGAVDSTEGLIVGQSNFPGITGLGNAIQGTGGSIGLLGPIISVPGTNISLPAFSMLLQATQTDNSVNILSTPSILTMDNEEAEIVVGERVPFLRGVSGGGGGLGGLGSLAAGSALGGGQNQQGQRGTQQGSGLGGALGGAGGALGGALGGLGGGLVSPIDYQDVGLTLRIKPQVNDSRYVRLETNLEVSDIKGAGGSELTPTQTRRNSQTVVLVKDQSTVVIGGLMRDVENKTVEKVPFLGDVPLIGRIFRKTSTIESKQNLVLMLTPYIIESESDLQKIYRRKIKERRELLKLFGKQKAEPEKYINYQKKSGLVDRMRNNISEAVEDHEARERAREQFKQQGPQYQILGSDKPTPQNENRNGAGQPSPNGQPRQQAPNSKQQQQKSRPTPQSPSSGDTEQPSGESSGGDGQESDDADDSTQQ